MKQIIIQKIRIGDVYDILDASPIASADLQMYQISDENYDFIQEAMKNFKIAQYLLNRELEG